MVTEYRAVEFYDKKKGRNVHSAFPVGVTDDVNYDESLKAVLFMLNSRCNVSLEKTAQFVSDITDGALSPCVGMISGLCRGQGPPIETFGGILIHDHEACFYSYGSDHQECMVHIERYLRDSMENEKNLTWSGQMLELIQEMIHENNIASAEGIAEG